LFTKYLQLPKPERRNLLQAAWRLLVVRACLIGGIKRTEKWLGGRSGLHPRRPMSNPSPQHQLHDKTQSGDSGEVELTSMPDQSPVGHAGPTYDETPEGIWQRRALALKRLAPRLPGTHCLARALALRWWMRSQGLDAQMKIGIRTGPHGLESHAWVEHNNTPIDETRQNTATYKPLPHNQSPSTPWQP